MKKILSFYKANDSQNNLSKSLEILFNFVFVACSSLILSGFIVNNRTTNWHQMFFMLINASILSTHWFAFTVFKQRYEKRKTYFKVMALFQVLGLGLMAVGIDLLTFRLSGVTPGVTSGTDIQNGHVYKNLDYLEMRGLLIWLIGLIVSRLFVAYNFFMARRANKDNQSIFYLTVGKYISRLIVVLLAVVHLTLETVMPENRVLYLWIFMPLYLAIELAGNVFGVSDRNLADATPISFKYMNERYSNLIIIYISSIFVAGTVQFAFYMKKDGDDYMFARVIMMYLIGFMLWWLHSDRFHRFGIKPNAKHLHILSIITAIMVPAYAFFGGMLINANNNDNLSTIVPVMFFAMAVMLSMYMVVVKIFENKTDHETFSHRTKIIFSLQVVPFIVAFIVLGCLSLYFNFSIWVPYGVVFGSLVTLGVLSRITIRFTIKQINV